MLFESLGASLDAVTLDALDPFKHVDFLFKSWKGTLELGPIKLGLEKGPWEALMKTLNIGVSLVAAGFLLVEARARRIGQPLSKRLAMGIGIALTVIGFFNYFSYFNPNVRYHNYYHRHEFYHYYLGSKYFEELGYDRLYECTAVAETELRGRESMRKREIRDLRENNLIRPVTDTIVFKDPKQCVERFRPERWASFKTDITWFERTSRGDYWNNMQKDHGYNPPPVWTMTGKLFADLGTADDAFFKYLSLLDVGIHALILCLLGWAFGWRSMAIAAVFWGTNACGNFYWTGGAFLRHDWLLFMVASVCLARKKWYALSGAALMWSTLLRAFPVILFGGVIVMLLAELRRRRTFDPRALARYQKRFVIGAIAAACILVPASLQVAGKGSYRQFYEHIALHKSTPLTNHMGLDVILSHDWDGRMRFSRDDSVDDPFKGWKDGRLDRKHRLRPVFLAVVVALAAWIGWALRRTRQLWIAIPMGLPMVMSLTNLTCYYYCMFVIVAVLHRLRPGIGPALLAVAGASEVLLKELYWIDDRYTAESYLFYGFGLLMLYTYSRPFSLARLRAWWAGKAEPRGGEFPPPGTPVAAK